MRRLILQALFGGGAWLALAQLLGPCASQAAERPSTFSGSNQRLGLLMASNSVTGSVLPSPPTTNSLLPATPYQLSTASNMLIKPGGLSGRPASSIPVAPITNLSGSLAPATVFTSDDKYMLREGDVIEIKVYQEDDLTTRVRLGPGGEVPLPLLGGVRLGGKSVGQARNQVQALLAEDYLVNPLVTISLLEFAKRRFSVLGQVQQPGFYNIAENERLNILQAISMAGGFTRLANTSRVTVKRNVNGVETVLQVNVQGMARGARFIEVQAEDTIIVNERIF